MSEIFEIIITFISELFSGGSFEDKKGEKHDK